MNQKGLAVRILLVLFLSMATASAFGKNSRDIKLEHAASLNGTLVAPGEYKLSWDMDNEQGAVTLKSYSGSKVVTVKGKLVDRGLRYNRNSVQCETKPDGTRSLSEIRLSGTSQAIVFDEAIQK